MLTDPFGLCPEDEEGEEDYWLDDLQLGLNIAGLVPVIGEVADAANALLSLGRGDYIGAALSAAAMLPVGGQAATAAKLGMKAADRAFDTSRAAKNAPQAVNATGRARTVDQALTSAERHLGPGYREIAPGVFRSADGTRQFRMTTSDLTGRGMRGQPHVHFERIDPNTGKSLRNLHVPLIDP
jgi:hypothetical protein